MATAPSTPIVQTKVGDRLEELLRNAPLDDEPYTEEDAAAVAEAREDIAAGRVYSMAEVRRMLGLPPA